MEIVFFYKDHADKQALSESLKGKDWVDDLDVIQSFGKIIVYVLRGSEEEAESFAIAERYRGRKVVIDA